MKVYTKNGMELTLKEPQLKAGAEGAVYEIVGYPNRVIKIYHDVSQARMREDKIEQMTLIGMEQVGCSERDRLAARSRVRRLASLYRLWHEEDSSEGRAG